MGFEPMLLVLQTSTSPLGQSVSIVQSLNGGAPNRSRTCMYPTNLSTRSKREGILAH